MKVLVVGYGSIAKVHINNLCEIESIKNIYVYTQIKVDTTPHLKIKFVQGINDHKVDFCIIANQTAKHIDTALELAKQNVPLFIEKPISHNLNKTDELSKLVAKNKTPVFIAYNLRFLSAFTQLKELLDKNTIGKLFFAKIETGQNLAYWRPDTDYRKSYSANKDLGGGVALDLSHEIDLMRYLFGNPKSWHVIKTKVSHLEIDSDDLFEGIYHYSNNFVCNVHLDYLQEAKKRKIRIVGEKGELSCDVFEQTLQIKSNDNIQNQTDPKIFEIKDTYKAELLHFLEVIKNKTSPKVTLADGLAIHDLITPS
ncbi:hypothetical protein BVY03_03455 [bacterium K02(2017)]|nr:hypothetical protein BVY03_03455 [bacterium K02(2017)]